MTAILNSRKVPNEFLRNPGGDGGPSVTNVLAYSTNELESDGFVYTYLTLTEQEIGDRIAIPAGALAEGDLIEYEADYVLSQDGETDTSKFIAISIYFGGGVAAVPFIGLAYAPGGVYHIKVRCRGVVKSSTVVDLTYGISYDRSTIPVDASMPYFQDIFTQITIPSLEENITEVNNLVSVNDTSGAPKILKLNSALKLFKVGSGPGFPEEEDELLESNMVPFDNNYILGSVVARTGDILFDFTDAKLGAVSVMRWNDDSIPTFPAEAELLFNTASISLTADNVFSFKLVKKTATQKVWVTLGVVGGSSNVPATHITISTPTTQVFDLSGQESDSVVNFTLGAALTVDVTVVPVTADKASVITLTFLQSGGGGHAVSWDFPADTVVWQGGSEAIVGDADGELTVVSLFWNGAKFLASKSCGYS